MYILGLTGGIAGGKSTVAKLFAAHGAAIVDADAITHQLQKAGTPQTAAIAAKLGQNVLDAEGNLDRRALSAAIAADKGVLTFLEHILHPAVRQEEKRQVAAAAKAGKTLVILDVPLMYEAESHLLCDAVAVCDAPEHIRKVRAFERGHMTEEKWQTIKARRLPEAEMFARADILIPTSSDIATTESFVKSLYTRLSGMTGQTWPKEWSNI
ncbi:MAG: dephospho-CoA kinase [Proteobacteria bacterium]|nr:dephospho-CoA kinase [Pseudomonadota bacterium]